MHDKDGYKIQVGDILRSDYNYLVVVCKDDHNHLYGALVCDLNNSCRNIPYDLNNGIDYKFTGLSVP
jgi:hypothetical protein